MMTRSQSKKQQQKNPNHPCDDERTTGSIPPPPSPPVTIQTSRTSTHRNNNNNNTHRNTHNNNNNNTGISSNHNGSTPPIRRTIHSTTNEASSHPSITTVTTSTNNMTSKTSTTTTSTTTDTAVITTTGTNPSPPSSSLSSSSSTTTISVSTLTSLFATTFIPQHFLRINELPISHTFRSTHPNNNNCNHHHHNYSNHSLKQLLVPFVPICYCYGSSSSSSSSTNRREESLGNLPKQSPPSTTHATYAVSTTRPLHTFPIRTTISRGDKTTDAYKNNNHDGNNDDNDDDYYYYAIQQHRRGSSAPPRRNPVAGNNNTIPTDHNNNNNNNNNNNHTHNTMHNISNLKTYCNTWEDILQKEWYDVLLKYERFSQYSKSITIVVNSSSSVSTSTNHHHRHNNNNNNHIMNDRLTATISIRGMADASAPTLQIGDMVLLRPMYPISLPLSSITSYHYQNHQYQQQPLAQMMWTPPHHNIEIQATVLNVQRGSSTSSNNSNSSNGATDTVHISWLNPYESSMILYSMQHSQPSSSSSSSSSYTHPPPYHHHHHHPIPQSHTNVNINHHHPPNHNNGRPPPSSLSSSLRLHHGDHHRTNRNTTTEATFNIRFVPSNSHYLRCGTALDWFRESFLDDDDNDDDLNHLTNNDATARDHRTNENDGRGDQPITHTRMKNDHDSYYSMTDDDDDSQNNCSQNTEVDEDSYSHEEACNDIGNISNKNNQHPTNRHPSNPTEVSSPAAAAIMELLFPTTAPTDIVMVADTVPTSIMTSSLPHEHSATEEEMVDSTSSHNRRAPTLHDLNHKQRSFVRMIQTRTQQPSYGTIRGPLILTGPAGTGKTKTLLCALHTVLNDSTTTTTTISNTSNIKNHSSSINRMNRVLVCTPSHTASDVVTRRLGQYLTREQLFRLYGNDRPLATVPVDVLKYCYQSDDGTFGIPEVPNLMKFQVIVCTCSDAHLLYRIGLTNQQLRIRRQCYESYIQKCCEGTNLDVQINGVQEPHFTHIFIDEAAQATEPETLIPLSVVVDPMGNHRKVEIALVGDPRQLSPSVHSIEAAKMGLERSWMERLLLRPVSCLGGGRDDLLGPDFANIEDWLQYSLLNDGQDQLSFFLTLNYRGHPSFLMMPSALFYADKLHCVDRQTTATNWCAVIRHIENMSDPVIVTPMNRSVDIPDEIQCRKQFDWPIHFRGVVGNDVTIAIDADFASNSWQNMAEAETITAICVTLTEQGVPTNKIGVMSPYRGQVVLIRSLLRRKHLGGINVGTVEDYQSVEFDVILLSLVRSTLSFVDHDIQHRMGVFGQPKRSNVALTRAEYLFVVVGNPNVMAKDVVWKQFLLFCHRNGLYYGEQLDDTAALYWSSINSGDDGYKVVRSLTLHDSSSNASTTHDVATMDATIPSTRAAQELMAVSSLERFLRE